MSFLSEMMVVECEGSAEGQQAYGPSSTTSSSFSKKNNDYALTER